MTIKHIVFSGGGPTALSILGLAQCLQQNGFWDISNIETIYATSAGGMLGVILCLKFDWETIRTYFIKRPWHEAFPITAEQFINAYSKKGIFDSSAVHAMFKPLFDAKNIPLNITMLEFYKHSNIELNLFSLELNSYKLCNISYKTYPDLPVLTAIHMSSAIPLLISPVCFDGKCFIDGGIVNNYPVENCLLEHPNLDEIMSFKNVYIESIIPSEVEDNSTKLITEESDLFDFIVCLMRTIVTNMNVVKYTEIPYQVNCETEILSIEYFKKTLYSEEYRQKLFDKGVEDGDAFLKSGKVEQKMSKKILLRKVSQKNK